MGEITEVDVRQLRTVADRVSEAAELVVQMRWPQLDPDELAGSVVGSVAVPVMVAALLTELAAEMRGWALAARRSADAFECAEAHNADRVGR